jgi:hypothetical protein
VEGGGTAAVGGRWHCSAREVILQREALGREVLGNRDGVPQKRPKCRFDIVGKIGRWVKLLPFDAHQESSCLTPFADYFQQKRPIICPK